MSIDADQQRDYGEERYNAALCPACGASPCEWDGRPDGFHTDELPERKTLGCERHGYGPDYMACPHCQRERTEERNYLAALREHLDEGVELARSAQRQWAALASTLAGLRVPQMHVSLPDEDFERSAVLPGHLVHTDQQVRASLARLASRADALAAAYQRAAAHCERVRDGCADELVSAATVDEGGAR